MITVVGQSLSCVQLFATTCTAPHQAPLSSTISQSLFIIIELMMPFNHLIILCWSLWFLPSIFPSIRVFCIESVLHINWAKYWSFSISFQWIFRVDFFLDRLVWAPCSPRDTQESFSAPQFESINSLACSLLYGPTLTSILDYRKNHSFD